MANGLDHVRTSEDSTRHQYAESHLYKFDRTDVDFIALLNLSDDALATAATKLGIRTRTHSHRVLEKTELAARVFAVRKRTNSNPDWFEPTIIRTEYWKPQIIRFFQWILVLCTMFAVNYGRAYYARVWNCHWPTITNLGGILETPFCTGLRWVDSIWDGLQKSFVYGSAATVAYAIPTILGWRLQT